jgi:hypothetical protein
VLNSRFTESSLFLYVDFSEFDLSGKKSDFEDFHVFPHKICTISPPAGCFLNGIFVSLLMPESRDFRVRRSDYV